MDRFYGGKRLGSNENKCLPCYERGNVLRKWH